MKENIIYVGVDVDDQSFHGSALIPATGELLDFKCRPNVKGLCNQLQILKDKFPKLEIKVCYEATYIGFTLQRDLSAHGYFCEVIAPSSIPRVHGNQIKTDRIDASKLAQFYASGILTIVTPPEPEMEADRDLMRSREFMLHQLSEIRTHIQSLLRRNNLHYKSETQHCAHWTKHHL
jgi:transposase